MDIGIYNEPTGASLGGCELCVAVLAEALSRVHRVEIVHHRDGLRADVLGAFSGTDLGAVRLRHVPKRRNPLGDSRMPWRRYQEARSWNADLSAPYDVFVNFTHGIPPFCHAPCGVLVVLFPMFTPLHRSPPESAGIWQSLRRRYSQFEWQQRLGTYQVSVAISEYTRTWLDRMWGVDARIVYPPTDLAVNDLHKEDLIASVGRFGLGGHVKCQLEMVQAFTSMTLPNWQYVTAGGLGADAKDQAYVQAIRDAAAGSAVTIATSLSRDEVRNLYARAKIFWHAAGYTNPDSSPELNEHFGISTVEAMSAGCVPIVINKGGPAEIVEHGVSGFAWNSLDELQRHTETLAHDPVLWTRMSAAARQRARRFDRKHYVESMFRLLDPENCGS